MDSGPSDWRLVDDLEHDVELQQAAQALSASGAIDLTSIEALADSAPVRKLLNMVLLLAIKDHASDLHFEPFEDEFRIRIKADGVLYEMVPPPRHLRCSPRPRSNLHLGRTGHPGGPCRCRRGRH